MDTKLTTKKVKLKQKPVVKMIKTKLKMHPSKKYKYFKTFYLCIFNLFMLYTFYLFMINLFINDLSFYTLQPTIFEHSSFLQVELCAAKVYSFPCY